MKVSIIGSMLLVAVLAACAPKVQIGTGSPSAHATIRSASGATLGVLTLRSASDVIQITGNLTSLPGGVHGIHLHETGICEAPGFTTAGAHLNPVGTQHGLNNPAGPHAGDLPNITVNSAGAVSVDLATRSPVSLTAGTSGGLFDRDGTAIVIHAAADDQMTDPSGNSGARIACGVVERL